MTTPLNATAIANSLVDIAANLDDILEELKNLEIVAVQLTRIADALEIDNLKRGVYIENAAAGKSEEHEGDPQISE